MIKYLTGFRILNIKFQIKTLLENAVKVSIKITNALSPTAIQDSLCSLFSIFWIVRTVHQAIRVSAQCNYLHFCERKSQKSF